MAANDCIFDHGQYATEEYTPTGGDVLGGEVILLGNTTGLTCGIAHEPITNNTAGTLAIGGGVYRGVNLNNAANYTKIYWDASVRKYTTVSTNNALFGYVTRGGGAGANTNCYARHMPNA